MTSDKNYTPIDNLIKRTSNQAFDYTGPSKETLITTSASSEAGHVDDVIDKIGERPVEMSEIVEHEPAPDVQVFVEHRPETVRLHASLQKMGVASTAVPNFITQEPLHLPLTDDEIVHAGQMSFHSSLRWLGEYCVYLLKRAHLHLKIIAGKPVRVKEA